MIIKRLKKKINNQNNKKLRMDLKLNQSLKMYLNLNQKNFQMMINGMNYIKILQTRKIQQKKNNKDK